MSLCSAVDAWYMQMVHLLVSDHCLLMKSLFLVVSRTLQDDLVILYFLPARSLSLRVRNDSRSNQYGGHLFSDVLDCVCCGRDQAQREVSSCFL